MGFKNIKYYPLRDEIDKIDWLYAHTHENSDKKEKLEEHMDKTVYYFKKIYREKNLEDLRKDLHERLEVLEGIMSDLFDEMCINVFYMHDLGKMNINYQLKKMRNEHFKGICDSDTRHSILSSAIYIEHFINRIKEEGIKGKDRDLLHTYMVLNAYVISKHHGYLQDFYSFEEQLDEIYKSYEYKPHSHLFKLYKGSTLNDKKGLVMGPRILEKIFIRIHESLGKSEEEWGMAYPYIYTKVMHSLLVACDFYATSDYMGQQEVEDIGRLTNIEQWEKAYESGTTYKSICKYQSEKKAKPIDLSQVTHINSLRSEMFLEATENLLQHMDEDVFYLEAPTGSGKTNTSIQLALTLLKEQGKNKLFYVFPFNTLVEQTKHALDEVFKEDPWCQSNIEVVNSITPITSKQLEKSKEEAWESFDYNRMLLDRQFLHYPLVITSHVQLFNLLFGGGGEEVRGLDQLINSVVILDEVQSYKNAIWTEMISFLKKYAKLLHMKVIIMSATLPQLGQLTLDTQDITSLITEREKYFSHPLFKERVKIDFSLLYEEDVYEKLMDKVVALAKEGHKKILVEFIHKKTAVRFYDDLLERMENEESHQRIMLLTGDDSKWEREKCIGYIKDEKNKEMILVATQLIEAGVDIDMDYGLKDISLLDAEEQFLGRINRSCKRADCWAYFFNLDSATVLYKSDYRKEKSVTLLDEGMQDILRSKNFEKYYAAIFEALRVHNEAYNKHNLESFKTSVLQNLKYGEVKKRMELIDEEIYPCTVFLGIEIEIEENGEKRVIDGKKVWEKYADLLKNQKMPYAEKKVKLFNMREEMSCFMWKVKHMDVSYTAQIGDIFYIHEGEQYMDHGKFNRERLCGSSFEII